MTKDMMQTLAIIAAIFMAAWAVRGDIAANTAAIAELRGEVKSDIADLRGELKSEIAELRGALMVHISGHGHAPIVAAADSQTGAQ
ncbi:MAG: hypothetical protein ACR2P5_01320 [Gammaproteobacteria bacterium]